MPHLKPYLCATLAAMAAALVVPAAGHAGTAYVQHTRQCDEAGAVCGTHVSLRYEDPGAAVNPKPAEVNTVTLTTISGGRISVRDETAPVAASHHCEAQSEHEVWCSTWDDAWDDAVTVLDAQDDTLDATALEGPRLIAFGGTGRDMLIGTESDDELIGQEGGDVLDGGLGSDLMVGGDGIDTVDYGSRGLPVAVSLGGSGGTDLDRDGVADPGLERDAIRGVEDAIGGEGPDVLVGHSLPNLLRGGPGGDVLDGAGGADTLDGETGTDTLSYANRAASAPVAVALDGIRNDGADTDRDGVSEAGEERDRDIAIENATGGAGHDRLTGDGGANVLAGGLGMDRLDGGLGADTLDGGLGLDTAAYGRRGAAEPVAVVLDGVRNDGADPNRDGASSIGEERDRDISIENATGGAGPDVLRAQLASANFLTGNGGDDRLFARDGGSAVDRVACGAGNDSYQADPGDTTAGCETALP